VDAKLVWKYLPYKEPNVDHAARRQHFTGCTKIEGFSVLNKT